VKDKSIIIRKVRKNSDEGHHGGQWKVAYADFITAMMAFFLLMWLLTMASPEKRVRVATYFRHFTIFEHSGSSFMEKTRDVFSESGESEKNIPGGLYEAFNMKPEEFKEVIGNAIEERLGDIKDQIIVDIFEGGVQIQLVDNEGKPMFELSSSKPTSMATRILQVIGENIKTIPHHVVIEGHTDSLPYKSLNYSNWELSTDRALVARKILEEYGLDQSRLVRIAGYADTVPFLREDPKDPRNRRISIILLFPLNKGG
jgi:chemotaxis protein MotB